MSLKLHPLLERPTVPCVDCKTEMVPLGKMGDTGKKRCTKCKNKSQAQYQKKWHKAHYKNRYKKKTFTCERCKKKFQGTQREVCQLCQMIILDLYQNAHDNNCIYCDKPCGSKMFCTNNCRSKTLKMASKRKKRIDEVLKN